MEPTYWQDRLARLDGQSRRMQVMNREDLAPPGVQVLELNLVTYDERKIQALVAHAKGPVVRVQIHWRMNPTMAMTSFHGVSSELAQLHIVMDPHRRLEERVLDFLALLSAARDLSIVNGSNPAIELAPGQRVFDEYRIGRALIKKGWCKSINPEKIHIEYI